MPNSTPPVYAKAEFSHKKSGRSREGDRPGCDACFGQRLRLGELQGSVHFPGNRVLAGRALYACREVGELAPNAIVRCRGNADPDGFNLDAAVGVEPEAPPADPLGESGPPCNATEPSQATRSELICSPDEERVGR